MKSDVIGVKTKARVRAQGGISSFMEFALASSRLLLLNASQAASYWLKLVVFAS